MARIVHRESVLARLADGNLVIDPREIHMEVMDAERKQVWLAVESISMDDFQAFEPKPPFVKTGAAVSPMDLVAFRRSPGQPEYGPATRREIGGRSLIHVASLGAAPKRPFGPDGPMEIWVLKHQTVGFDAGHTLPILCRPDGSEFIQQTGMAPEDDRLVLPDGWKIRRVELREALTLEMQDEGPTTYWFPGMLSFQGPVEGLPR